MKKTLLVSIIMLSMLALTLAPIAKAPITEASVIKSSGTPTHVFTVNPVRAQFEESADFTLGDPVGTYVPWDVDIINAEYPSNGGQGVYVAVIDTGLVSDWASFVAPGAIIETGLARGWSYDIVWNPGINDFDFIQDPARGFITDPLYGSGHGTHVACEIVGYQRSTIGVSPHVVQGVAPNVHIIPLLGLDTWLVDCPDPNYYNDYWGTINHDGKVLFRGGDDWMLCSAIDYVASLAEAHPGWKIICTNSWGGGGEDPALRTSIDNAIGKGVIFTFAAGNSGSAGMDWPGAYPEVISCAAGGWTMQMVGYAPSNPPSPYRWYLSDVPEKLNTKNDPFQAGSKYTNNWQIFLEDFSGLPNKDLGQTWKDLDVCAPGAYVVGPYKPEVAWSGTAWAYIGAATAYYGLWGTSMATPHVAGIAAIIASCYPQFNQADMEYVLKKAATHIPMASDGAFVYDTIPWVFKWNDHDYGNGWLTLDNAIKAADTYVFGPYTPA
jgi:subtilisin family serine protease